MRWQLSLIRLNLVEVAKEIEDEQDDNWWQMTLQVSHGITV